MSTITAEPETQTVFRSKSPNLVLTRRPTTFITNQFGAKVTQTYAGWIREEEDRNRDRETPRPIDDTPWKVEFLNSEYVVPDFLEGHKVSDEGKAQIVEWLRQHPQLNVPGPTGFWELGNAPDEPKPSILEQMVAIADASATADLDKLEAVVRLEQETHNRRDVLMAAETGMARLRELEPESGSEGGSEEDSDEPRASDD